MIAGWLSVVLLFGWIVGSAVTMQAQQAPRQPAADPPRAPRLKLQTNAFRDAGPLPLKYSCYAEGGKAVSPPLQWSYTPRGTQSFVLMLTAPQNHRAKGLLETHFWVRWNIPASIAELPEGVPVGVELPDGSRQVVSEEIVGYNPPCSPPGVGELHYEFKLYALDTMLTLPVNATYQDVLKAIDGHIVGASTYYTVLERLPQ